MRLEFLHLAGGNALRPPREGSWLRPAATIRAASVRSLS